MRQRKRMLITGASGMLGNNLARYFRGAFEVLGLYGAHRVQIEGVQTAGADLERPAEFADRMRDFQPDVVIHCAGLASVDECEADPSRTERLNVGGTRTAVEGTPRGAKFVYISSDSVYDGTKGDYRETDPVHPL
ncbi:MAG: sugar nucleotide-binding protein, partial [Phycisphaerae bacterium]